MIANKRVPLPRAIDACVSGFCCKGYGNTPRNEKRGDKPLVAYVDAADDPNESISSRTLSGTIRTIFWTGGPRMVVIENPRGCDFTLIMEKFETFFRGGYSWAVFESNTAWSLFTCGGSDGVSADHLKVF